MYIYVKQPMMSVIGGGTEGDTVITKELHCRHNKMLLAIRCMGCSGCPSARSAIGVCPTDQSQGSQTISVQLHPTALLC